MDIMSGYGEYNSDSIIHYSIINYNFIRPHSSLPKFMATRHDQDSKVNMTPVMAGGYPKWFATFSEVLAEAWGYDKSFVFKLGPERMKHLRVGIRDKKTVVVSAKEEMPQGKVLELDRILQVECGFTNTPNSNEWKRQMPSIRNCSPHIIRQTINVSSIGRRLDTKLHEQMKICVNSMLCLMAWPQIHLPNVKTCLDVVNTYVNSEHEPEKAGKHGSRDAGADV